MTNLIKLDPSFRVLLPEGATGAAGELEYASSYRVAALLAGATSGVRVVVPDAQQPRLGKIVPLSGQGDVLLLGATLGDPVPPYVTVRIYPTGGTAGRGEPILLSGRPHEHPPGSGVWDFHDLDEDPNGPTVASREEKLSLSAATARANTAAGSVAAAQLELKKEKETVTGFVDGQVARVDKAVADTAQMGAEALALTGIDPAYISETTADPAVAPQGTKGARRTESGGIVRLESDGAAWQTRGEAVPGAGEFREVRDALNVPDVAALESVPYAAQRVWVGGVRGGGDMFELLAPGDPAPSDGGRILAVPNGKRRRVIDRPISPKDYGGDPTGQVDSTQAVEMALNNEPMVLSEPGATYKINGKIKGSYSVKLLGQGFLFRELPNVTPNKDIEGRGQQQSTRIIQVADDLTAGDAWFEFVGPGSEMSNFELAFNGHAPFANGWTPAETGYAVNFNSRGGRAENLLLRGPRRGLRFGKEGEGDGGNGSADRIFSGCYDNAVTVENTSDVVTLGYIQQSIYHSGFQKSAIEYMLANLYTIWLKRCDNPRLENVFGLFARALLYLTGPCPKVSFGRLEADESIYGVLASGRFDLFGETLVHQRFTTNPVYVGAAAPSSEGQAIYTQGAAQGDIQIANLRSTYGLERAATFNGSHRVQLSNIEADTAASEAFYAGGNTTLAIANYELRTGQSLYSGPGTFRGRLFGRTQVGAITVPPLGEVGFGVSVPGCRPWMNAALSCENDLPLGVVMKPARPGTDGVGGTFVNYTNSPIDVPAATWRGMAWG